MIASEVLDASLQYIIDNTTHIYLCNNMPTTYNEAINTYMLGYKEGPTFTGPSDDGEGGRYITLGAITDGVAQNSGWVEFVVLVDAVNDNVLKVKAISELTEVQAGQPFTTTEMDIGMALDD